ncbi:MAG: helix-turn-helix domain-containing protein [Clostridia bacterium]|nr:helix-turn-helix domain-containing protein [Clostridia bacterium]
MRNIETTIDARTREETSPAVQAEFPYRTSICDLGLLPENLCPWHWHNEVELFYMESGGLIYHLPGGVYPFRPGDVGFVNAGVLHMTSPLDAAHCRQQEHIFLPRLIGGAPDSAIDRQYVRPLTQNALADIIIISADDPNAADMRAAMDAAFRAYQARPFGYELTIRGCMDRLWLALLRRMPDAAHGRESADGPRIKAMLAFIESHYSQPIALSDIAAAASVGPRECSRCFRRQLGLSPFEYLLRYRVNRACELLRGSDAPVGQVALNCGFASASYFGKLFRERLGVSPSEYRRGAEG